MKYEHWKQYASLNIFEEIIEARIFGGKYAIIVSGELSTFPESLYRVTIIELKLYGNPKVLAELELQDTSAMLYGWHGPGSQYSDANGKPYVSTAFNLCNIIETRNNVFWITGRGRYITVIDFRNYFNYPDNYDIEENYTTITIPDIVDEQVEIQGQNYTTYWSRPVAAIEADGYVALMSHLGTRFCNSSGNFMTNSSTGNSLHRWTVPLDFDPLVPEEYFFPCYNVCKIGLIFYGKLGYIGIGIATSFKPGSDIIIRGKIFENGPSERYYRKFLGPMFIPDPETQEFRYFELPTGSGAYMTPDSTRPFQRVANTNYLLGYRDTSGFEYLVNTNQIRPGNVLLDVGSGAIGKGEVIAGIMFPEKSQYQSFGVSVGLDSHPDNYSIGVGSAVCINLFGLPYESMPGWAWKEDPPGSGNWYPENDVTVEVNTYGGHFVSTFTGAKEVKVGSVAVGTALLCSDNLPGRIEIYNAVTLRRTYPGSEPPKPDDIQYYYLFRPGDYLSAANHANIYTTFTPQRLVDLKGFKVGELIGDGNYPKVTYGTPVQKFSTDGWFICTELAAIDRGYAWGNLHYFPDMINCTQEKTGTSVSITNGHRIAPGTQVLDAKIIGAAQTSISVDRPTFFSVGFHYVKSRALSDSGKKISAKVPTGVTFTRIESNGLASLEGVVFSKRVSYKLDNTTPLGVFPYKAGVCTVIDESITIGEEYPGYKIFVSGYYMIRFGANLSEDPNGVMIYRNVNIGEPAVINASVNGSRVTLVVDNIYAGEDYNLNIQNVSDAEGKRTIYTFSKNFKGV